MVLRRRLPDTAAQNGTRCGGGGERVCVCECVCVREGGGSSSGSGSTHPLEGLTSMKLRASAGSWNLTWYQGVNGKAAASLSIDVATAVANCVECTYYNIASDGHTSASGCLNHHHHHRLTSHLYKTIDSASTVTDRL
jgi:hypothetical protein